MSTVPTHYILQCSTTNCTSCGTESHESTFMAVSPIRLPNGQKGRHIVPCTHPLYNLPVERVTTAPRQTPFCHACRSINLLHLPEPPKEANLNVVPVAPRPTPHPTTLPRPAAAKKPFRIEDLA